LGEEQKSLGKQATFDAISLLYPDFMRAEQDEGFYKAVIAKAKIRERKNTPRVLGLVKAVHVLAGKTIASSTEHDWTKLLRAAKVKDVDASTTAMQAFIEQLKADKKTTGLSVFKAADAILNPPKDGSEKPVSATPPKDVLQAIVAAAEENPVGSLNPRDGTECPEGLWIGLNHGGTSLRAFIVDDKKLYAVLKELGAVQNL
jgi:hypothetical protein